MHRLLIVDDEPFITDGLFRFIQNMKYSNLDVYKAYTAEEAMEWLNKTKIDIVVSDIQMPGMNGLQLVKEIHDKWPMCRVIFLTGFNNFDYAYTAMQYGVVSYILKSEGDNAILKAIEKCIADIDKTTMNEELVKKAYEQVEKSLPILQKEYLMDMLQGDMVSSEIRQQHFDELHIPLRTKAPLLLIGGRIDNYAEAHTSSEKVRYLSGIEVVFQEYLGKAVLSANISWDRRFILWMVQPRNMDSYNDNNDKWSKCITFIKGTLESVQETCKQSLGISLSLVLDNKTATLEELPERFYSMKQIVNYKIGTGIEMVLTDKNFYHSELLKISENNNINQKMQEYLEKLERLKTYLEGGQREEFFILLKDAVEYLLKYGQANYYFGLEMYHSINLMFLAYINRMNLKDMIESEFGLSRLTSPKELIIDKETFENFFRMGECIFRYQKNEEKQRFDTLIISLHKYIHDHLGGDLSLVTLSEKVYLNPAYLSRLYKQVTGRNLSDYISEHRLGRAKKLLQKNEMKINEIAVFIGYESAAHFSRIFKRATNMTPQEYRDAVNVGKGMSGN